MINSTLMMVYLPGTNPGRDVAFKFAGLDAGGGSEDIYRENARTAGWNRNAADRGKRVDIILKGEFQWN